MFAIRLVHLIEEHADQLSEGLLKKLKQSEACNDLLSLVPDSELKSRAFEIYRHVSDWLSTRTESEIEERYIGLGARRAQQDVPYSQMLYAIQAVKEHLWEFLRQEGLLEPQELLGEFELLYTLERFFDRVAYFAAVGYENARARQVAHALTQHQGLR
ncbi:MAG TPA: hypothetical protein VL240_03795 [Candidatus Binatia bacterium]|nr:hypothetical protein [Candidatus Binatia bacterium]